jgi:hypothetical protein
VIPALLGGLFAIGPTIYQEYTKPRAVLSFTRVSGPTIGSGNSFRQISLIKIENEGRIPLTGVKLEVESADGQIESSAIEPATGLKPSEQISSTRYAVDMERMLPTEVLSASVMTNSLTPQPTLRVRVRSNEVLGSEAIAAHESVKPELLAIFLAMVGMVVGSSAMIFLMVLRKKRGGSSVFFSNLNIGADKSDLLTYLCALSGAIRLSNEMLYRDQHISYRRAGDLFLFSGLHGGAENKARCVLGLRALLSVVYPMNEISARSVQLNLASLGHAISEEEYAGLRSKAAAMNGNSLAARELIMSMFQK